MPYAWPQDTDFARWELDVLERDCPVCGRMMHICDHRYRHFHTLGGPVELVCKLNQGLIPKRGDGACIVGNIVGGVEEEQQASRSHAEGTGDGSASGSG